MMREIGAFAVCVGARKGANGVRSLTTTTFSEDSTLMAAGFSESYIRVWNLTGGKLPGLRNDFDSDEVTDGAFLLSATTCLPTH